MALFGKVFVATSGPAGPGRAVWSQVNDTTWQEMKDDQDELLEYSYCGPSRTQGSTTVRLKLMNEEAQTEVIITGDSIQIFVDGAYFGEYLGGWEREGLDGISEMGDSPPSVLSRKGSMGSRAGSDFSEMKSRGPRAGSRAGSDFSGLKGAAPAGAYPAAPVVPPPPPRPTKPVKAANCDKSPEMVEKLYAAVKAQDKDLVSSLLRNNSVDPDCICPSSNETPLMAAASKGPSALAEALLSAGADVNIGVGGNTPMLIAFQKGRQEVQRVLFASAFLQLECTVGALNPQAAMLAAMCSKPQPEEEMGEELHRHELKEVTTRLAHMQHPHHKPDPYALESSIELLPEGEGDSDKMREEVVRETMRALMQASKTTDLESRAEAGRPATAPAGAGR